jgi:hydrogenase small subunit
MSKPEETLGQMLARRGITRRTFLKFCTAMSSAMALPPGKAAEMAEKMAQTQRQSVIWLSFQECTGCTESITRSHNPTLESLIFDFISLDYHHTLQAASGDAAEHAREEAMAANKGKYIVVVDGSIPTGPNAHYSTIAGMTNEQILIDTAKDCAAIVAVGTCAAFGGIPAAKPNPTGAKPVSEIITDKPIINVSGCPPVPVVMTGTLSHVLTFGIPELDKHGRPKSFFGESIHDRCYRRPFYEKGQFAKSFDDAGARKGWCLYEVGCKGPTTYNACATVKWNNGTSFPIESGHGCIGCSEPNFWDQPGGFYKPLSVTEWGTYEGLAAAAAAGVAVGAAAAVASRVKQKKLQAQEKKS